MGKTAKNYIHARLGPEERLLFRELKAATGATDSALVKRGLRLVYQETVERVTSALRLSGRWVGHFASPLTDLSTNKRHLRGYGT